MKQDSVIRQGPKSVIMASPNLGQFDTLFKKNVPHILKKIFASLDYDSFVRCQEVCITWHQLLSSGAYLDISKDLLEVKKVNEIMLCLFSKKGDEREVKILLSMGVDPNCQTEMKTPLCNALYMICSSVGPPHDHINVVKLLLNAGATPWPSEIHLMQEYYKIIGQDGNN